MTMLCKWHKDMQPTAVGSDESECDVCRPMARLADCKFEINQLRKELGAAVPMLKLAVAMLRKVGSDYPGSSCEQWCEEHARICEEPLSWIRNDPSAAQWNKS